MRLVDSLLLCRGPRTVDQCSYLNITKVCHCLVFIAPYYVLLFLFLPFFPTPFHKGKAMMNKVYVCSKNKIFLDPTLPRPEELVQGRTTSEFILKDMLRKSWPETQRDLSIPVPVQSTAGRQRRRSGKYLPVKRAGAVSLQSNPVWSRGGGGLGKEKSWGSVGELEVYTKKLGWKRWRRSTSLWIGSKPDRGGW